MPASTRDLVDSIEAGRSTVATWRKSPSQATSQGVWFDLSMSPGNPVPQYYASSPGVAATLPGTEGLNAGGAVSPRVKHLKTAGVLANSATGLPMRLTLLDYLLYYPFLDMGSNDVQEMSNPVSPPRYSDGAGVMAMPVMVGAQVTGGATIQIGYTNQDGVSGRLSTVVACNTATATGSVITSDRAGAGRVGPFLPLQSGDTGIRSIETFQMVTGTDVGLITLVLVKPLANLTLAERTAPSETDYLLTAPSLPRIHDGAYLNFIVNPSGSLAATALHGYLETVWS